ncbi:MAG TPA: PhoX family phosphatase [Hyphomicrobiales bacterium]|nr:PhoX family phosphatase [Hyphomicrobiales bacterium]
MPSTPISLEDTGTNPTTNRQFADVLAATLQRRQFLQIGMGLGAAVATRTSLAAAQQASTLTFTEVPHGLDEQFTIPAGYHQQILLRWGDPLFPDAPTFDPQHQSKAAQERQFGFNNDFIGFVPLPPGSANADHGLLVVNHEYTDPGMMYPGGPNAAELDRAFTDVDIAAHGLSVVEIRRRDGVWKVQRDSAYNRRITPLTSMQLSGPAAGSARLRTQDSQDGIATFGTYGNCAGGVTPWGTILTGEENVDAYFCGAVTDSEEAENYARFGMTLNERSWGKHYPRWNLAQNPREPLHVGWIVEIDPYDPTSVPRKRTALGRFKHEGCNVFIDPDGSVVAYSGDDSQFEYLYKFVSAGRYDPADRNANFALLDEGTLHAARFEDDGMLHWLPLVHGEGPLTDANGFHSQADVLIDARKAADLLGATPMDRPEDVEVNPVTGRVFAMLTNNTKRTAAQLDAANPRAQNGHGQIVEFWPASGRHTDTVFRWELFLLAGDPRTESFTAYHPAISANGWLSCPDNCAFDRHGNLWIATDGAEGAGVADGVWAAEVDGEQRALTKRFLRAPVGAEMCGPFFTPDDTTFFCSVQHPGQGSSLAAPSTRWPDFDPALPPRPAVVAITREDGGRVGS